MSTEDVKRHGKSAALTFASAMGVELLIAMNTADTWADLGWMPLLSASSFVAVRAVLKAALEFRGGGNG